MKESKSKWSKIIHRFLDSEFSILRLDEPLSTEHCVVGLKRYLEGKNLPIGYTKRGTSIYIFRTDCPFATMNLAMNGEYIHPEKAFKHTRPAWMYVEERNRKRAGEIA